MGKRSGFPTKTMTRTKTNAADDGREEAYNAMTEGIETVHRANGWRLTVREDGSVETHEMGATRSSPYTTRDEWFGMDGEDYRCGRTIEGVLSRYAHETRFERGPEEHGAVLRDGIIDALQSVATDATCAKCEGRATHVTHTNAPANVNTKLVCDDHANERTYVTLYALDSATEEA